VAHVKIVYSVVNGENNSEYVPHDTDRVCAVLLGGIVPEGGVRRVAYGDLKAGDKFRCAHDDGPEATVVSTGPTDP
jgi:hypothetical protein